MLNLWARIQLVKVHYQTGALSRGEYCAALALLFNEAREALHD